MNLNNTDDLINIEILFLSNFRALSGIQNSYFSPRRRRHIDFQNDFC